jgi:hypothetical protein
MPVNQGERYKVYGIRCTECGFKKLKENSFTSRTTCLIPAGCVNYPYRTSDLTPSIIYILKKPMISSTSFELGAGFVDFKGLPVPPTGVILIQ